jgi:hypothetical protein
MVQSLASIDGSALSGPAKIPAMEYDDVLPDMTCPACEFSGFIHREAFSEETVVRGVPVGYIEKIVLSCSSCYARHEDDDAPDWHEEALKRYRSITAGATA